MEKQKITLRRWLYEQNDVMLRRFYHDYEELHEPTELLEFIKFVEKATAETYKLHPTLIEIMNERAKKLLIGTKFSPLQPIE